MRNPSSILLYSMFLMLFGLSSCQNESADVVTKKTIDSISTEAKPLNVSNETPTMDTKEEEISEESTEKEAKEDLIEFYVKEDKEAKDKSAAKKEEEKTAAAKLKETSNKTEKDTEAPKKKKAAPKKRAKIVFDKEVFQFGIIKPGDVIEHKFHFTNTGNQDLLIKDAQASCGCTQPSFPFIPIKPGEKGFIGVKYDSKGKLGQQKPSITLTTNGSPSTKKIYLEGLVISEMAKQ